MNILVFDSTLERARKCAAAFPSSSRVFLKRGNQIVSHPKEEPVVGTFDCDLVFLHADEDDEQLLRNYMSSGTVKPASFLRFSGGGCQDGIPWPVKADVPLTESVAGEIASVCERFPPRQREQEFKRMWSGVPELLLAWTLSKQCASDFLTCIFKASEIAESYKQLRTAVASRSRSNNLPTEPLEGEFPRLEDAKLLIELSRLDL